MFTERAQRARTARPPFFRAALDSFFLPSLCVACSAREVERVLQGGVCRSCWDGMPTPAASRCGRCDEPLAAAQADVCGRCLLDPPAFERLRGAAPYRGSARGILIAFKFRGADFLARHLAEAITARVVLDGPYGEVVPVPARLFSRLRRDHAAETLAAVLAVRIGAPLSARRLRKVRATKRQSGLPLDRRRSNVRRAFEASGRPAERVLLVDDVATSGSTARECSRALVDAGARHVDVVCFARATRDDEIAAA
jgi:predicted amidophosphoribosyltransferase